MTKELKRKVLSEERKGLISGLLAEGHSEFQVASILKMSKTAAHKNKVKLMVSETPKLDSQRKRTNLH